MYAHKYLLPERKVSHLDASVITSEQIFRHVCLKESSSDFTIFTAVSDFMIADSLIEARSSYFCGVTSLSGCEEDGGKRHFFQSSTIYLAENNSRFIMLLRNK